MAWWRAAASTGAGRWSPPLIYTIARNKRIDLLCPSARPIDSEHWLVVLAPKEKDAGKSVLAGQTYIGVTELLEGLPKDQSVVIQMAFFADKKHTAVAEKLKLPLGTVTSRILLALGRLWEALEKDEK